MMCEMNTITEQEYLIQLAQSLDTATRLGDGIDDPEGSRYIQVSDTLARVIANHLRKIAEMLESIK